MSPKFAWIPILGDLWVVTNVALGGLGIYINWPTRCAFAAGLINGTLPAAIASLVAEWVVSARRKADGAPMASG